ncbi:hypothetical protein SPRG_13359 [Saprolegnia parasitica CBS 223.65]|uniref:TORTIFOLIA1/SINE1-2 N-terminal domain-containing protein n=1 Tax=Saprolegnia parasitica (strain CBS 223.65) TaxID=695850 RepID=A0A067BSP7_SAPPC|nr:hypothetical protein SPRG_13359 [Saprolegnia parasitica CBS 223.65]KDO21549.1 hypothetical protein SPRG_13359 [Saprolegnia parasitica CBS 223.65]|eukprot:XP_012207726.1 hypothetical protein SPRG_13359 [Saprolegnia parasitica CBS 223.65]
MSGTSDKQQRKTIAEWIDKLQARDTEKQAFVALAYVVHAATKATDALCRSAIPHLAANSVPKVLLDLERKHPDPVLMSTRENVVLLIELMCTTQAPACAKLRNRITAYLNRRLRDKRSKVTDACVGAAGALALHALPFLPPSELETIVQPFWTEVHIMNDGAARCLGAIFYPSSGDAALLAAHAARAMGYLISFLPQLMAKLHGKIYATYSPIFHILLRIVVLIQDVPACVELATAMADAIPSLVTAIDDVLHVGQRDDWLNRKRGLDLLGALVACFGSHTTVVSLQAKLMQLAERGRSDYASPVRESASALLTHLGPLLRTSQPDHGSTDVAYAALHPVRPSSPSPPSPARWVSSSPSKPTSFKKP